MDRRDRSPNQKLKGRIEAEEARLGLVFYRETQRSTTRSKRAFRGIWREAERELLTVK